MLTLRDDSGISLQGAVDGVNATYLTQLPMRLDRPVDVYVNGQCLFADLDNGYSFPDAQTVILKETPLPGDTVSVRYCATPVLAGVPNAQPEGLTVLLSDDRGLPLTASIQDQPKLSANLTCCC